VKTREEERETSSGSIDAAVEEMARECVARRLRLLNRVMTKLYDDALRALEVTASQMNLLVLTARLEVAQPSQVSRILQMDLSTLSRNLERLRARGWIEPVPESDARLRPFRLTDAGREKIREAYPAWQEAQRKASALLGEEGVALLDRTARSLISQRVEE
jgi:DNA-binding MarR family transcriptional regulator